MPYGLLRDDFVEPGSLEQFLVEEVIGEVADVDLKAHLKRLAEATRDGRRLGFADLDPA